MTQTADIPSRARRRVGYTVFDAATGLVPVDNRNRIFSESLTRFRITDADRKRGKPVPFPGDPPADLAFQRAYADAGNPGVVMTDTYPEFGHPREWERPMSPGHAPPPHFAAHVLRADRAFQEGWEDCILGLNDNPYRLYVEPKACQAWAAGWATANKDRTK